MAVDRINSEVKKGKIQVMVRIRPYLECEENRDCI
jgi:hypothetical protein